MQVQFNGRMTACHAVDAGSIPATCSRFFYKGDTTYVKRSKKTFSPEQD